jgi:hypothetical protein
MSGCPNRSIRNQLTINPIPGISKPTSLTVGLLGTDTGPDFITHREN